MLPRVELWSDSAGAIRWSVISINGVRLANSAVGYESKSAALEGLQVLRAAASCRTIYYRYYDPMNEEHKFEKL